MKYEHFFQEVLGKRPYHHQLLMEKEIASGKNMIVRAPTGSGKTWGAHLPFIQSLVKKEPIADKLIHILPMRTLVNDLFKKYKDIMGTFEKKSIQLTLSENLNFTFSDAKKKSKFVTIQTGEYPGDQFLQGTIVFSTYDQILSSFLGTPLSLSNRMANINHGALIGAILIFDEIHLFDRYKALSTTLAMLEKIGKYCQIIIMTATMTDAMIDSLKTMLNANVVDLYKNNNYSLKNSRSLTWVEEPLNFIEIKNQYNKKYGRDFLTSNKKIIIVCNTSNKAQELYLNFNNKDNVFLIHGQLSPTQRKKVEKEIRIKFYKLGEPPAILISTQVIEVGIDITSDLLITEVATASSIIQRMGRCARREKENGDILVFNLEKSQKGSLLYGPYVSNKQIVNKNILRLQNTQDKIIDFDWEIQLMNQTSLDVDKEFFQSFSSKEINLKDIIWRKSNKSQVYSDYIREIDNVNVVLADETELTNLKEKLNKGFRIQWMSVSRIKLTTYLKNKDCGTKKIGWIPVQSESEEHKDSYEFQCISTDCIINYPQIIIQNRFVIYTTELGLYLGSWDHNLNNDQYYLDYKLRNTHTGFSYKKTKWTKHAENTYKAMKELIEYNKIGLSKLKTNLNEDKVEAYLHLTAIFHDLGKLQVNWQKDIGGLPEDVLSHNIKRKITTSHARESGLLARLLYGLMKKQNLNCELLTSSSLLAIMTHHGFKYQGKSSLRNIKELNWIENLESVLKRTQIVEAEDFSRISNKAILKMSHGLAGKYNEGLINSVEKVLHSNFEWTIAWFLFVRLLRFADQLSFSIDDKV